MVLDYGSRGELGGRRARALRAATTVAWAIGVAGPVLSFAAIPTLMGLGTGAHDPHEPSRGVHGPPCRQESAQRFAAGWARPPRTFAFEGVSFGRRSGDADCVVMHDGPLGSLYPACRFTSPSGVAVTAHGQTVFYDTLPGSVVEVEARPGGVRCVIAGHRSFQDLLDGY